MCKKGNIPWNKGKKGLQKAWNKGLTKDTDIRVKQCSESKSGISLTKQHRKNIRNGKLGIKLKPLTDEHKQKISVSNKGKKKRSKTKEEKDHQRKIMLGRPAPNRYTYKSLLDKYPKLFECLEIKQFNEYIKVKCCECGYWFIPKREVLTEKIRRINISQITTIFCSDTCKENSTLYRAKKDPQLLSDYKRYCREVEYETRKSVKFHFDKILNINLRSYYYHLDHKYSMFEGFKNNVEPKLIGHYKNLHVLSKRKNESKAEKCIITLKELKELFND